ncbi:MAG: LysE family transporter [Spirosomataceae bacterium]
MKPLFVFGVTCLVSFMGSVQLGPVNVAVIRATIQHNLRTALWLACGGCLPEILYGLLALHGVLFFQQYPFVFQLLQWSLVPVLLIAGGLLFIKKPSAQDTAITPKSRKISLTEGFVLALLNPQLVAFWTIILLNYQNYAWLNIDSWLTELAFLLGTSAGAFGILYLFACLAHHYRERLFQRIPTQTINQVVGGIFILIGLIQAAKLLW